MAKLPRVTGKVFGGSAPLAEIGQFGSAKAGTPTNTQDVATIQALTAYDEGWGSAVVTTKNFPPIEEVTGALKTISYQACYILQEGIPEYDIGTEYSNTSIVKSISGSNLSFYISLQNGNKGNALSDTDYWVKADNLNADGPFYSGANVELNTSTARGSYTLDLSGSLPADGFDYLCLFKYFLERRDNSNSDTTYYINVGAKTYLTTSVEGDPSSSTNYHRVGGQVLAIIGSGRSITVGISGDHDLNSSSFELLTYRRIGTNSN